MATTMIFKNLWRRKTRTLLTVLGAIGGLYLAWRAANLRPVEALRYQ